MSEFTNVDRNSNNGFYENGKSFSANKWATIKETYWHQVQKTGERTVRLLAKLAAVSEGTAAKAIGVAASGKSVPVAKKRGHGKTGPDSLSYFGTAP